MSANNIHYSNYEQHQKQRSYLVFYYYNKDTADHFQYLLESHQIPFERGEGRDLVKRHLFGIHVSHEQEAKELNDKANALYRKPFLSDKHIRNAVLIFTLVLTLIALAGYIIKN